MLKKLLVFFTLLTCVNFIGCQKLISDSDILDEIDNSVPNWINVLNEQAISKINENKAFFPNFDITYEVKGDEIIYKFNFKDSEHYLLLNYFQNELSVNGNGKSIDLDVYNVFDEATEVYATIKLRDLTGDGKNELYVASSTGGTGVLDTKVNIINLENMEKYKVCDYVKQVAHAVEATAMNIVNADSENFVEIEICLNDKTIISKLEPIEHFELSDYEYIPENQGQWNNTWIEEDCDKINIEVGLTIGKQWTSVFLCKVNGTLSFSQEKNSFELDKMLTVEDI